MSLIRQLNRTIYSHGQMTADQQNHEHDLLTMHLAVLLALVPPCLFPPSLNNFCMAAARHCVCALHMPSRKVFQYSTTVHLWYLVQQGLVTHSECETTPDSCCIGSSQYNPHLAFGRHSKSGSFVLPSRRPPCLFFLRETL